MSTTGAWLRAAVPVVIGLSLFGVMAAHNQEREFREIQGARMYIVLPRDAIPAIDDPALVPVGEAGDRAHPDELFLGVEINGEAHAYSTWLLESHEIVNDEIGGEPIAAEW